MQQRQSLFVELDVPAALGSLLADVIISARGSAQRVAVLIECSAGPGLVMMRFSCVQFSCCQWLCSTMAVLDYHAFQHWMYRLAWFVSVGLGLSGRGARQGWWFVACTGHCFGH